jgi:integrase
MSKGRERFERTQYPGIYRRFYREKPVGYHVKGISITGSFDRLTDARDWLEREVADLCRRQAAPSTSHTLHEAIERYRSEELPRLAATERPNRDRLLALWDAMLGAGEIREIGSPRVREILSALREEGPKGRPIKYATTNRYRAALSAVLSACVDWEWIDLNPLHSGSRRKKAKGDREEERDREVSVDEWERLWAALQASRDSRLYALTVCALASGGREGELMSMERASLRLDPVEVDPYTGESRPGVPRVKISDTKSGEARTLYFPGLAGQLLRAQLGRLPVLSRYVWAERGDAPGRPPEFPTGAWRYAKKRAGLHDFRFHDLRHEWACMALLLGVSEFELLLSGGWRSPLMVRRYSKQAQHRSEGAFYLIRALGLATGGPAAGTLLRFPG